MASVSPPYRLPPASGLHTPSTPSRGRTIPISGFSDGDTVLDYLFHLFKNNSMALSLASTDVGPAGVEGDETGQATRTPQPGANRKRRRAADERDAALIHLADNASIMAATMKQQSRAAELASYASTLKNLTDAGEDDGLIDEVKKRMRDILVPAGEQRTPEECVAPMAGQVADGGSSEVDDFDSEAQV